MSPPASPPCVLALTPPNRLAYGDRKAHVGPAVWSALFVVSERGGRVPVAEFCRAVWETDAVARRAIWALCHRANEALEGVGCPARLLTQAGDVVLSLFS
jgi:hypothetical protein